MSVARFLVCLTCCILISVLDAAGLDRHVISRKIKSALSGKGQWTTEKSVQLGQMLDEWQVDQWPSHSTKVITEADIPKLLKAALPQGAVINERNRPAGQLMRLTWHTEPGVDVWLDWGILETVVDAQQQLVLDLLNYGGNIIVEPDMVMVKRSQSVALVYRNIILRCSVHTSGKAFQAQSTQHAGQVLTELRDRLKALPTADPESLAQVSVSTVQDGPLLVGDVQDLRFNIPPEFKNYKFTIRCLDRGKYEEKKSRRDGETTIIKTVKPKAAGTLHFQVCGTSPDGRVVERSVEVNVEDGTSASGQK